MFVEKSEINFYAWYVYQALCGKNGYFKSGDIKANIRQDEAFDKEDKEYFRTFSGQHFLDPISLRLMSKDKLGKFYQEIDTHFKKRCSQTKRLQFDTVAILKTLQKQGFQVLDIINHHQDVTYRKKEFQILLRKEKIFLLIEDDYLDHGSTFKLYAGVWTPILLSVNKEYSLKLIYSIPHRRKNASNYLVRISDVVRACVQVIK